MSEYITMRDCLKLDLKDAIAERDSLQDQRDFCMGEMQRLRKERDEANKELHKQLEKYDALFDEAEKIRMERDEAREALREIAAADWKTSGELRGMARRVLEAAK